MQSKFTVDYVKNYSTSLADDFQLFLDAMSCFDENPSYENKNILYKEWEYLMFAIKGNVVVDVVQDDFAHDFCQYIGELVDDKF